MANDTDYLPCEKCGKSNHINVLDAKPTPGGDPNDFNRLECIDCYGAGYDTMRGEADMVYLSPAQREKYLTNKAGGAQ